jgi:hypothetical protein
MALWWPFEGHPWLAVGNSLLLQFQHSRLNSVCSKALSAMSRHLTRLGMQKIPFEMSITCTVLNVNPSISSVVIEWRRGSKKGTVLGAILIYCILHVILYHEAYMQMDMPIIANVGNCCVGWSSAITGVGCVQRGVVQ